MTIWDGGDDWDDDDDWEDDDAPSVMPGLVPGIHALLYGSE